MPDDQDNIGMWVTCISPTIVQGQIAERMATGESVEEAAFNVASEYASVEIKRLRQQHLMAIGDGNGDSHRPCDVFTSRNPFQ